MKIGTIKMKSNSTSTYSRNNFTKEKDSVWSVRLNNVEYKKCNKLYFLSLNKMTNKYEKFDEIIRDVILNTRNGKLEIFMNSGFIYTLPLTENSFYKSKRPDIKCFELESERTKWLKNNK